MQTTDMYARHSLLPRRLLSYEHPFVAISVSRHSLSQPLQLSARSLHLR